jgi:threonine/homoserine/homoserine lactone efflux protein
MWVHAPRKINASAQLPNRAFRQGFLINLLNPKSMLFAAAVPIIAFPPDMSPAQNGLIVANHLGVEMIFYTTLAFGMSSQAVSTRYLRAKAVLDRVAAAVLGALGLRLLLSR